MHYNASLATNVIHPDSSDTTSSGTDQVETTYYLDGLVDTRTDQRGVTIDYDYRDYGEGRQLEWERVTLPSVTSVDDHVLGLRRYYDSRGRMYRVRSYSASTGGDHRVDKSHQSHEGAATTSDAYVEYFYDYSTDSGGLYNDNMRHYKTKYPSGDSVIQYFSGVTDDRFNRRSRIEGDFTGTTEELVAYAYTGAHCVIKIDYDVPDVKMLYDTGADGAYEYLDRFGRVKSQRWAGSVYQKDRYNYEHDDVGNRTARKVEDFVNSDPNLDQTFTYDDAHRLKSFSEGTTEDQNWTLDAWGNWEQFKYGGIATTQDRTFNDANETLTLGGWQNPVYDAAGNMTSVPDPANLSTTLLTLKYDAWNRVVEVKRGSTVLAEYEYDGLHRRIVRTTDPGTGSEKEYHSYYNTSNQELEVREGSETAAALEQFVWHPHYIDALAVRYYDTGDDGSMDSADDVFYVTHDANYNVTSLIDTSENVLERYDYTPYGELLVRDADFSDDADNVSDTENNYTYTGRKFDPESGLYYYRARYYSPNVGSFISRDPIGFAAGDPNIYRYVGNGPLSFTDPSGLILESGWDVANVGMGIISAGANIYVGNFGAAAVDVGGVIIDVTATAIPGVPGGAGTAIKASRAAKRVGSGVMMSIREPIKSRTR